MTPLHWTDCRPELEDRLSRVPRLLVASDFDGTLAPICARPAEVVLPELTRQCLARLASAPGVRVAVISGRELSQLIPMVGLNQVAYGGNHGLEIKGAGMDYVHPGALASRGDLDGAAEILQSGLAGIHGSLLEHKGLSLSVHYRNVAEADRRKVLEAVAAAAAAYSTLVQRTGKMVVEFRPDVPWHKGTALKRLMKGLGLPAAATLYMGDDATDEDAFEVLNGTGTSLHVGENPATLARYRLDHPADAASFLEWLASLRIKGSL